MVCAHPDNPNDSRTMNARAPLPNLPDPPPVPASTFAPGGSGPSQSSAPAHTRRAEHWHHQNIGLARRIFGHHPMQRTAAGAGVNGRDVSTLERGLSGERFTDLTTEQRAADCLQAHKTPTNGRLCRHLLSGSMFTGGPRGNRTPVFGVRGRRPRPLDDGTDKWLGDQDSNLDNQIQSLAYCRCTIPQHLSTSRTARGWYRIKITQTAGRVKSKVQTLW